MRTILHQGTFYEVCQRCGPGGHCRASKGDPRRCQEHRDREFEIKRMLKPLRVKGSGDDPSL